MQDKNNNGKLDDTEKYFFLDVNEYIDQVKVRLQDADYSAPKYLSGSFVNKEILELRFNKTLEFFSYEKVLPESNFALFYDKRNLKLYNYESWTDSTEYIFLNVKAKSSNDSLAQIDTLRVKSGKLKDNDTFIWKNSFSEKKLLYSNKPEIKLVFNKPLEKEIKPQINCVYPTKYSLGDYEIVISFEKELPYFKDINLDIENIVSISKETIKRIKIFFQRIRPYVNGT